MSVPLLAPVPASPLEAPLSLRDLASGLEAVAAPIHRVVLGKETQVKLAITCLVAGGHLLIEDIPGVGKTTLAESLARSFELSFARVQLTADLLPSDLVGVQVLQPQTGAFQFRPGPLFHQLVLADELNRAPPRTQSALLEAMAQAQVSVDGTTHALPLPFAVIATQNPLEGAGTYPLPDSQLDRFLMRLSLGHPSLEMEIQMLTRGGHAPLEELTPVLSAERLLRFQARAAGVAVHKAVAEYGAQLAHATREHPELERGVSTRALLALFSAARAHALWDARDFVTPGDLKAVLVPAWAHRLLWRRAHSPQAARDEATALLEELLRRVPAPR